MAARVWRRRCGGTGVAARVVGGVVAWVVGGMEAVVDRDGRGGGRVKLMWVAAGGGGGGAG